MWPFDAVAILLLLLLLLRMILRIMWVVGFEVAMVAATSTLVTATSLLTVVFVDEVEADGAVTASKIRGRFRVVLFVVVAVLLVAVVGPVVVAVVVA
jgi:hypothetical protein